MSLDHSLEDSTLSGLTGQYNYEMMTYLCSVDVANIKSQNQTVIDIQPGENPLLLHFLSLDNFKPL